MDNKSSIQISQIGAWQEDGMTLFTVWAPLRKGVELVLVHPESAVHSMDRDEWGYWRIRLPAAVGTRYFFRLDGQISCPDPASLCQPDGVHSPSEVVDREDFRWEDGDWKGIPLGNMIIYELHVGTFSVAGDFDGVLEKLDYLSSLGVNTIELMPLGQCPGERNWGYDGVYPFAVQRSYGARQDLKRLVNAAHAKGIAVILDVIYNHLGPEGNYLPEYGPYFTKKYHVPWGDALNFDDAWSDGVRNYFLQNADMWLDEFHIDGLRLDAVHAIKDFSAQPFIKQLKDRSAIISQQAGYKKEIIAELDLNDPRYLEPSEKGGYGLDGLWNDEFHHALHSLLTGEQNGYYEDFGSLNQLEAAFKHTFVYDGNYSPHRKRHFGHPVGTLSYDRFIVFSQNHDQIGNRPQGDRLTASLSLEQLKLAAAAVLLSPYTPLLFMGEEYGEPHPFQFFTDYSDPKLIAGVREGRKNEFKFVNAGDLPDPQAFATFEQSILSWSRAEPSTTIFRYYQELIRFRKNRLAMQGKTRDTMALGPASNGLLCFSRKLDRDQIWVWLNFNPEIMAITNDGASSLVRIFDSSAEIWADPDPGRREICPGGSIRLSPFSATVFELNQELS